MPGIVGYAGDVLKALDTRVLQKMVESIRNKPWQKVLFVNSDHFVYIGLVGLQIPTYNTVTVNENSEIGLIIYGKAYYRSNPISAYALLNLYEKFELSVFPELNGSWAIVLWDSQKRKIILCNDHFATRPFFYANHNGTLVFSSEVKGILSYPRSYTLDRKAVALWFGLGRIIGDRTFFGEIKYLPPATFLNFENGKLTLEKYYDLNYKSDNLPSDTFTNILVKRFEEAINKSVHPDQRYVISLSGGLDSRCVLSEAIRINKECIAFSFGPRTCSDVRVASRVARKAKAKHFIIYFNENMLSKYAREAVFLTDGMVPVHCSVWIPLVLERLRAKVGDAVCLQGYALDLLLGGSYLDDQIMSAENDSLMHLLYSKLVLFTQKELKHLFTSEFYESVKETVFRELSNALKDSKGECAPNISDYFFIRHHVCRLTNLGSTIIRNYFEEALPTLDLNFMEIVTKIPPNKRYQHRIYKSFLKKLNSSLAALPYEKTWIRADSPYLLWRVGSFLKSVNPNIVRRLWRLSRGRIWLPNRNTYFDFNQALYCPSWQKLLKETILNKKAIIYEMNIINRAYVHSLVKDHFSGLKDNSKKIAYLVTFELFLEILFELYNFELSRNCKA
ncbi:MAG: asparagine synthase-related protein [Candidatus Methanomethyliaceae archaeon]